MIYKLRAGEFVELFGIKRNAIRNLFKARGLSVKEVPSLKYLITQMSAKNSAKGLVKHLMGVPPKISG